MKTIKVLIVDDSAVVRQVLSGLLDDEPGIEVLATAADPIFAMEKMRVAWPDVIVLDVEMPRMDGISFLKKIMAERPTPVVICSTLTEKGAETTMQALAARAGSRKCTTAGRPPAPRTRKPAWCSACPRKPSSWVRRTGCCPCRKFR